jgi:hypothetical protein
LVGAAILRTYAREAIAEQERGIWVADRIAALLLVLLMTALAIRSRAFGVDTVYYSEHFATYCTGGDLNFLDRSFSIAVLLLNSAMLGTCRVELLPWAWAAIVLAGLALMAGPIGFRARFAALFLVSMVGVELTTNALRQGFSAVLLVASISHWPRNRRASVVLAVASLALHGSAGLALAAYTVAAMPLRRVVIVLVVSVTAIALNLDVSVSVPGLSSFLYEIRKYMGHESDEIWVRVLAFATAAGTIAAFAVVAPRALIDKSGRGTDLRRALGLALTCIPFLVVPYFGYRYVYAVYPLVLFCCLRGAQPDARTAARAFWLILAPSAAVLLAWSLGSAYMSQVPFIETTG